MVHIQKKVKKRKQGLAQEDTASMCQDDHWVSYFSPGKTEALTPHPREVRDWVSHPETHPRAPCPWLTIPLGLSSLLGGHKQKER